MSLFYRKKGKKGGAKKTESVAKLAIANSKTWEAKLDIAELAKQEYRYVIYNIQLKQTCMVLRKFTA